MSIVLEESSASAERLPKDELRFRLCSILGADRWVPGSYPAVSPLSTDEVSKLLKGYSGSIMVVGNGSSFPEAFNPGRDTLILLTNRLEEHLEISNADQTITVSAGWEIGHVKSKLNEAGMFVEVLDYIEKGTIGGRLASISSRPSLEGTQGWIQDLLGILVVLPSGDVLEIGNRCIKDVAGYDIRHFFPGSRGAVGVITGVVFRCKSLSVRYKVFSSLAQMRVGSYDAQWRKVFDPFSRMKPGY